MIVKPIPAKLLIHEISYEGYAGTDGWNGNFDAVVEITQVRVEPAINLRRSGQSVSSEAKHVVFVDRTNSSSFPEFKEQSRVTWKGKAYEIFAVKPFYDVLDVPHHYELELK